MSAAFQPVLAVTEVALPNAIDEQLRIWNRKQVEPRSGTQCSPDWLIDPAKPLNSMTKNARPEEVLRTLVESELAARDASNIVNRLNAAAFPVTKTLESFDVAASSIQPKDFDYLSGLKMGSDAIESSDHRARRDREVAHPDRARSRRDPRRAQGSLLHRRQTVETLYRGLADNTVGKIIE